MKNGIFIILITIMTLLTTIMFSLSLPDNNKINNETSPNILSGTIIKLDKDKITIQTNKDAIYTFNNTIDNQLNIGNNIELTLNNSLNKNFEIQNNQIIDFKILDQDILINDNGIFKDYYDKAKNIVNNMTIDEKISQIFLVRVPQEEKQQEFINYQFGGYLFFERDFKNKTKNEVIEMINDFQEKSKIPLLTAIDEEGGKVSRISSNKNLVNEPFKSSQELYHLGGFELIKQDTINKSNILNELGLNLNLAPVVDISINENDYMFERSFGKDKELTSKYAKTVIETSKNTNVSYTLKHFPGYGNNIDTHVNSSIDERSYHDILNNDLLPFKEGINARCEAILISHNIIENIDSSPASLSPSIHNLLRNELNFTGIIITDDMYMGAVKEIDNAITKAILAGNDLIITTEYEKSFQEVKNSLTNNILNENQITKLATRIIAWKLYKGLL